jgi:penicillin-binding protein 1C
LDLPFRCAVKTGTSSDFRDNWCLGFTPEFTVGVWAGNFEQQPMKVLSGIAGAGPIFNRAMMRLYRDTKPTWFTRPSGLVDISIDSRNDKLITEAVRNPYLVREIVPQDRLLISATSADYDASGKVFLNSSYAEWFSVAITSAETILQ